MERDIAYRIRVHVTAIVTGGMVMPLIEAHAKQYLRQISFGRRVVAMRLHNVQYLS